MTVGTILVAVDFAPASLRAVELACTLVKGQRAEIVLFHACDVRGLGYVPGAAPVDVIVELRAEADAKLSAMVRRLSAAGFRVRAQVRDGEAATEVIAAAHAFGADLVVVGTHGRRGIARALLGSVAERIVRQCPVPVLTAHDAYFETRDDAGSALARTIDAPREAFDHVFAASRGATPIAVAVAQALGLLADVFLVEPLIGGLPATTCGVVCEEGAMVDLPLAARCGVNKPERAAARAVQHAIEESERLRRHAERTSPDARALLLVFESFETLDLPRFGVAALRFLGAERVAVATPVCARRMIDELAREGTSAFAAIVTELDPPPPTFGEEHEPTVSEAAKALPRAALPAAPR